MMARRTVLRRAWHLLVAAVGLSAASRVGRHTEVTVRLRYASALSAAFVWDELSPGVPLHLSFCRVGSLVSLREEPLGCLPPAAARLAAEASAQGRTCELRLVKAWKDQAGRSALHVLVRTTTVRGRQGQGQGAVGRECTS